MKQKEKALIAVMLGNSIFGFSFLFSKLALAETVPAVMIAMRFTVAFLVLNAVVAIGRILKNREGKPLVVFSLKGKPLKYVLLLALFQPVIYFPAESYGIVYTSSAFAGIIIAIIPIAGILADVLMMHGRVSRLQVVCAVGSVLGVALTSVGARDMAASGKGILFLLVAVAAGALFYVFSAKASEHFSALERTYVMFGVGSAVFLLAAAVQCRGNVAALVLHPMTVPVFWVSIAYLSVVSSVFAFLLLNYGANYVSVSRATIFANLTTVISILVGVVILKETFTLPQFVGTLIILISVYFASVKGKTEKDRAEV